MKMTGIGMRTLLFLLAGLLPPPPVASYYTHDVCSFIHIDPMWSSTHYMPTVLERTIKRKGGKLGPFHCPVCGSALAYASDWDPNALRETGRCVPLLCTSHNTPHFVVHL